MAIPETPPETGTPASISDRVALQTEDEVDAEDEEVDEDEDVGVLIPLE